MPTSHRFLDDLGGGRGAGRSLDLLPHPVEPDADVGVAKQRADRTTQRFLRLLAKFQMDSEAKLGEPAGDGALLGRL
jgi:hypothetical protein